MARYFRIRNEKWKIKEKTMDLIINRLRLKCEVPNDAKLPHNLRIYIYIYIFSHWRTNTLNNYHVPEKSTLQSIFAAGKYERFLTYAESFVPAQILRLSTFETSFIFHTFCSATHANNSLSLKQSSAINWTRNNDTNESKVVILTRTIVTR